MNWQVIAEAMLNNLGGESYASSESGETTGGGAANPLEPVQRGSQGSRARGRVYRLERRDRVGVEKGHADSAGFCPATAQGGTQR